MIPGPQIPNQPVEDNGCSAFADCMFSESFVAGEPTITAAVPHLIRCLRMRTTIILTVAVLTLFGAAFAAHRYVDRNYAQPSRDLSKMMSVRLITGDALSEHYKNHGSYPGSLSELPLETLRWGDEGSSPKDLESWHYTSDEQSFSMTWQGMRNTKLFLGGKSGQIYYSEDQKR